jgi:hypothetical protein
MNRELLKRALDAQKFAIDDLKLRAKLDGNDGVLNISHSTYLKMQDSMIAISSELAKPEPDPVAWVNAITGDLTLNDKSHTVSWAPLYTSPPQQKPLTREEIKRIRIETPSSIGSLDFARAIEKAHGIID